MRQAGIIAAPGIIALEKMIDRLKEDHENAKFLAEGIMKIDGIKVDLEAVQTNMVRFDISGMDVPDELFLLELKRKGILASTVAKNSVRMVTHRGIEKGHIEKTINVIRNMERELVGKQSHSGEN